MKTAENFIDCYPPEIVEWLASFPSPSNLSAQQRWIVQIIEDPRTIAAAGHYFATLEDCDTPEEANGMITRFIELVEDTAKPKDVTGAFLERLSSVH